MKIYPNCKPGLRRISGKQVDAVLEVPAGQHLLAHGQVIEMGESMSKESMTPTGNCPVCRQPKVACHATTACWMAAGAKDRMVASSVSNITDHDEHWEKTAGATWPGDMIAESGKNLSAEHRHSLMESCPGCKQAKLVCKGLPECMTEVNQQYKAAQASGVSKALEHLRSADQEIKNAMASVVDPGLQQSQSAVQDAIRLLTGIGE